MNTDTVGKKKKHRKKQGFDGSCKWQLMASGLKCIFIKCDIQQSQHQAARLVDRRVLMTNQRLSGSVPLVQLFVPELGGRFQVASYTEDDSDTVLQPVVKKHYRKTSTSPALEQVQHIRL